MVHRHGSERNLSREPSPRRWAPHEEDVMAEKDRGQTLLDPVDEPSLESFPASDPPGWILIRPGPPVEIVERLENHPAARSAWNEALERAPARVENARGHRRAEALAQSIRDMKRAEPDERGPLAGY